MCRGSLGSGHIVSVSNVCVKRGRSICCTKVSLEVVLEKNRPGDVSVDVYVVEEI